MKVGSDIQGKAGILEISSLLSYMYDLWFCYYPTKMKQKKKKTSEV